MAVLAAMFSLVFMMIKEEIGGDLGDENTQTFYWRNTFIFINYYLPPSEIVNYQSLTVKNYFQLKIKNQSHPNNTSSECQKYDTNYAKL